MNRYFFKELPRIIVFGEKNDKLLIQSWVFVQPQLRLLTDRDLGASPVAQAPEPAQAKRIFLLKREVLNQLIKGKIDKIYKQI